jgi:hypothetical protein
MLSGLNAEKQVSVLDQHSRIGFYQKLRTVIIKLHFLIKIADRNYQIADHNNGVCSLIRSDKKVQKLRTTIFGARNANLQF